MRLKNLDNVRRDLPLPALLIDLIQTDRWVHPGDDVMLERVPFIRDPLVFLGSQDEMLEESGPLMGPDEIEREIVSEYRGSAIGERDLPWIDVERSLFIICNVRLGDDVGIALDYRPDINLPRVVGGDWHSSKNHVYREISPTFEAFVDLLGL